VDTARKGAVGLVVVALIIWAAFIVWWATDAYSAAHHLSATDWQGNHRAKVRVLHKAFVVGGLPPLGAALAWVFGPLVARSKPVPLCTAVGFLTGALGLGVAALVEFAIALSRFEFVF
jgi:hypothetical protein